MRKAFIAYTRVSTVRQGTNGVSLSEQHRAISEYADKNDIIVLEWFEEQQSAAKQGRPIFSKMLKTITDGRGQIGLILHKIDRGARNLRDWASIGEAIDLGVDVRFAHDDFDLTTRGGRLAADIQAVIAADYIRNLREEVRKGIHGRLHQGIYPLRAPRGYRDCGSGKVKMPDPIIAPLIIAAFDRYATRTYTLQSLATELATQGLTGKRGQPLRPTAISRILRNPFYVGEMRVAGHSYPGIHQPIISSEKFEAVQRVLDVNRRDKPRRHHFKYQRLLRCRECQKTLTGERQKQHVYYRCHSCPGVSVREDRISDEKTGVSYVSDVQKTKCLKAYCEFESR